MSLFRSYSIRGVSGCDLTEDVAVRIGSAFGTFLRRRGMYRVAVGRDMRLSSPSLCAALEAGLLRTGCQVLDLGMISTPQLNFSTDFVGADAGVMVTASHNPPQDNGFKLRTHHTILGEELDEVESLFVSGDFASGDGSIVELETTAEYVSAVKTRVRVAQPVRVIVDGGNGMAGPLASRLFAELGCDLCCMYCEPDGGFPHHHPNPADPENLNDLVRAVESAAPRVDVGLAYDGDGDRVGIVTDEGEILTADYLIILLARHLFRLREPGTVVVDAMSSQAVIDEIRRLRGRPIVSEVGYALVQKEMRRHDALLAGEMSGHLFIRDPLFTFDDSLLASCVLMEILSTTGESLSGLLSNVPRYHMTPQVRVKVSDRRKIQVVDRIREEFGRRYEISTVDGVRISFERGWAIVRASRTQAAVVYKAEAQDEEELHRIVSLVESSLERAVEGEGIDSKR